MWIQSIILKNHRDIPVLWRNIIDHSISDTNHTGGDFLKTCNHPQNGGFPAPRRAYQNDKFPALYIKGHAVNDFNLSKLLNHLFEDNVCHDTVLFVKYG